MKRQRLESLSSEEDQTPKNVIKKENTTPSPKNKSPKAMKIKETVDTKSVKTEKDEIKLSPKKEELKENISNNIKKENGEDDFTPKVLGKYSPRDYKILWEPSRFYLQLGLYQYLGNELNSYHWTIATPSAFVM